MRRLEDHARLQPGGKTMTVTRQHSEPTTGIETMSKHYYLDAAVFEAEKNRLFYRHWQCIGHVCELPAPGSYFVADLAGESILAVKQEDGAVLAFYNVCQHRAHRLASERGSCDRFVCPYHGWTYHLDGVLKGARGTADVTGFADRRIRLKAVRLEVVSGLIFINLDDEAAPLGATLGGAVQELQTACPGLADMKQVAEHTWTHECNWKVSVENFSECYHCPVAHKYLVANTYTAEDYRITFEGPIIRHSTKGHRDPSVHGADLLIWFVWPNFAIELYPLHRAISLRHFWPRGRHRTDYVYRWYVAPELEPAHVQEVVDYARVHHASTGQEDMDITREVYRGLHSRGYEAGPLVVTPEISNESENALAHWQAVYLSEMAGD
jgi:phenylpropionate dioxygenase-like ring-hydroxylating dioxygenase large terminal subunit